jgi:hypothetical protein
MALSGCWGPDHVVPFRKQRKISFIGDELLAYVSKAASENSELVNYLDFIFKAEVQKRDNEIALLKLRLEGKASEMARKDRELEWWQKVVHKNRGGAWHAQ